MADLGKYCLGMPSDLALDQKNPETSKPDEAAPVKSMAHVKSDDFTSTGDHSSADEDEEIEALTNELNELDLQEEGLNKRRRVEELRRIVVANKKTIEKLAISRSQLKKSDHDDQNEDVVFHLSMKGITTKNLRCSALPPLPY